jgi:mono/diheme cytochrome c family protein
MKPVRPVRISFEMNACKLLTVFLLAAMASAANAGAEPLYTVKDGNKVDAKTLNGWKTWRALACERCHGAQQEGLVGPPLVVSLKTLSKEDFHKTIMNGRPEKGMPPFSASKMVTDNWEGLYAYLKGRSDGKIKPGHVYPLDSKK